MRKSKFISSALALAMVCSLAVPTFATEITTKGESNSVPVELTSEAATFSVTVPSALPIDIDADGVVTVATDAKIVNNSNGPIEIKSIEVKSLNGWELVEYGTDFSGTKTNTKEYCLQFMGEEIPTSGAVTVSDYSVIDGNDELAITYNADAAIQSTAIEEDVAQLVVVVDWYEEDGSSDTSSEPEVTEPYTLSAKWGSMLSADISEEGLVTVTTTFDASKMSIDCVYNDSTNVSVSVIDTNTMTFEYCGDGDYAFTALYAPESGGTMTVSDTFTITKN